MTTYRELVLADRPIGYWRLGEAPRDISRKAHDETQKLRHLDYNNFTPDDFGRAGAIYRGQDTAVAFRPVDPQPTISRSKSSDFAFAAGTAFSIEYWIKAKPNNGSDSNPTGIVTKGYAANQKRPYYIAAYQKGAGVGLHVRNGAGAGWGATSTRSIDDDVWHHVVGVYDGVSSLHLYLDGRSERNATGVSPDAYGTNPQPLTLGNHLNRKIDIELDEVAIYASALAAERVSAHYILGSGIEV